MLLAFGLRPSVGRLASTVAQAAQALLRPVLVLRGFGCLFAELIQPKPVLVLWRLRRCRAGLFEGRPCFGLLAALHQPVIRRIKMNLAQRLGVPRPRGLDFILELLALLQLGVDDRLPLILITPQRPYTPSICTRSRARTVNLKPLTLVALH